MPLSPANQNLIPDRPKHGERWIDENTGALFEIIAVGSMLIFYKPVAGGKVTTCPIDLWPHTMKRYPS